MLRRLALFVLAVTPLTAQDPKGPAEGFAQQLRRIHVDMARGRFETARRKLDRLLAAHKEQRYAFVHKATLLEDYRRCAFYTRHPAPSAAQSLHGELLDYDPKKHKARIRYTRQRLEDFDEPEALADTPRRVRWHPGLWRAPYSIEITGGSYRETIHEINRVREIVLSTCVHVTDGDGQHVEIEFGNRRGRRVERPARIVAWDPADKPKELAAKDSPLALGAAFRLRIDVGKKTIRVFANGKALLSTRRGGDGRFAIEGTDFDQLTVHGRVDPGWIADRVDRKRQEQFDEFDRSYDAEEVPEWLLAGGIAQQRTFNPSEAWPQDAKDRHHPILSDLVGYFETNQYQDGLDYLARLAESDPDALPRDTRNYLKARFYFELDEVEWAFAHAQRLVRSDKSFLTGRRLLAELRVRMGQGADAAIADYRAMLRDHPKARELHVDLAVLLIQDGRARAAEKVLRDAVRAIGNQESLMDLQRMLLAVTRGPSWEKTHEFRSDNYLVRSNIDRQLCETAAKLLESAREEFAKALGQPARRTKERYRVFLFKGQTGYERFCQDILGERDTHTAGLYSAALRQLLIWNLPDRQAMLRTIRHEGLHQYLDSIVHDAPAWLNEGLAEYFEVDVKGTPRKDLLQRLAGRTLQPTARFVRMPAKVFYRGTGTNYAQAWALVHFLRHGPERWRGILSAVLGRLGQGKSPASAVRLGFAKVDFAAFDRDLAAHVDALQRR